MTQTGIACFLAICRYKTITRAAEMLYITQSSLSMRLKNLETELGGTLFFRRKGSREMILTAAGKEFYALAVQYTALEEEMKRVCKKQPTTFRIAFFNSLGTYLLPEVFELLLQEHPQLHLELQDMDLDAAEKSRYRYLPLHCPATGRSAWIGAAAFPTGTKKSFLRRPPRSQFPL